MRTPHSRVVTVFFAIIAVVFAVSRPAAAQGQPDQPFQHPGVLLSRAQLDYMKTMVAAHSEPFYSAFIKAQNSPSGSLNYQPYGPPSDGFIKCGSSSNPNIGCSNSDDDATAAYLQSLLWYITGNQQYANNAIKILNLYGYGLKGYSTGSPYSNAPLQAAWDGQKWPRAAEIIRYSNAGWSDADVQQFKSMLDTAIVPRIINGSTSNGNWEISMIEALINIGVFNDEPTLFNTGVTFWKQRIPAYFYYHTDGSQPVPAPRGTANWYGQTVFNSSVNGISQETCRDFGHAQYGISGAIDAAETAHIQGVDLYTDTGSNALNRLTSALEFNAYYLLGNPVPSYVCGGKVTLQVYPTDEIGYNEYHNRLGLDLPLTLNYLNTVIRQLPNPTEYHIMVYESLTHGGDASALQPFLMRATSSTATLRGGNDAIYTINVVPGSDADPSVALSLTGLPAGATYTFSPSTVNGAGSSTLTVSASSATAPGVYPLTVSGASGTATATVPLTLTINAPSADYSITASPSPITTVGGDTSNFTIDFSTSTGYLGNVALSVTSGLPAGASVSFSSPTISSSNPASTLTVVTPGTVTPGAYPITITATDGSVTHTTVALLIINTIANACISQLGDYWVSGVLPTQTGIFTAEWDATPSTALNNTNIGLSLGSQTAFTGLAVAARFNPTGQIDARNGGAFVAATTINYAAGVKYHFRAVVNVPAGNYSIYVTPQGQSEITIGTNYAFRSEQTGIKSIDHWDAISEVGIVALCNLVIDTPDFSIATAPSIRTVAAGNSASYTATVQPISTYSGTVSFNATGLPSGATATFAPATVAAGASTTLQLATDSSLAIGTYPFTITGTDGTLTHSAYLALVVTSPCDTPVAAAQSLNATENTASNITLVGSVGANCAVSDPLTYMIASKPTHGTLTGVPPNIVYTPAAGYTGSDYFTFTVADSAAVPATSSPSPLSIIISAGTVQLSTTAALSHQPDGSYQALIKVRNSGTAAAQNAQLTVATLGGASGSPLPASLGTISPGASATATISFPSSAGTPGSTVAERLTGTYTGGTFGGSSRAVLPQ